MGHIFGAGPFDRGHGFSIRQQHRGRRQLHRRIGYYRSASRSLFDELPVHDPRRDRGTQGIFAKLYRSSDSQTSSKPRKVSPPSEAWSRLNDCGSEQTRPEHHGGWLSAATHLVGAAFEALNASRQPCATVRTPRPMSSHRLPAAGRSSCSRCSRPPGGR